MRSEDWLHNHAHERWGDEEEAELVGVCSEGLSDAAHVRALERERHVDAEEAERHGENCLLGEPGAACEAVALSDTITRLHFCV